MIKIEFSPFFLLLPHRCNAQCPFHTRGCEKNEMRSLQWQAWYIWNAHLFTMSFRSSNVRFNFEKHLQIETLLKIKPLIQLFHYKRPQVYIHMVFLTNFSYAAAVEKHHKTRSVEIELSITIDILWINRLCVSLFYCFVVCYSFLLNAPFFSKGRTTLDGEIEGMENGLNINGPLYVWRVKVNCLLPNHWCVLKVIVEWEQTM